MLCWPTRKTSNLYDERGTDVLKRAGAAKDPQAPDLPAAPSTQSEPAVAPAVIDPAVLHATSGDIMAAAAREAAAIAREMNRAPDARRQFRSKTREDLDRRFEAAHAAGGSWFRAARVEEITTTGDGNARVYRIVTPFGSSCRTYPADGGRPMNTTCPRE